MLQISTALQSDSLDLQKILGAADGYLYLGMPTEALAELNDAPPLERQSASVLRARTRVLLHLKSWDEAEKLTRRSVALYPEDNEFAVQRAFALHQLDRGQAAAEALLAAPDWIRKSGILHYNLACYEARWGDLATARQCIRAAIELNANVKKTAKKDPDLQQLWS